MKKIACLMLFLLMGFVTQADLVDDFESYEVGDVATVASPPWTTIDAGVATIESEEGNKYITFQNSSASTWVPTRRTELPFDVDGIATLYFRVNAQSETLDHAIGLSDNPDLGWYDQLAGYVRLTDDSGAAADVVSLDVRDGGAFVDDIATLNVGQWYNVWLVIDPTNASGTFDVYCTEEGVSASGATPVYTGAVFRKAFSAPLNTFVLYAGIDTADTCVDDAYLSVGEYLMIPISGIPNSPVVEQGTPVGTTVPTTLRWKAADDPDGVYAVNPDIVDQYVFVGTDADPNLFYVGATAEDPGTDNPNSEYSLNLDLDTTYTWAIVEAMDGYTQSLTVGDPMTLVDPNNIIGPVWFFESTKSLPSIDVQPEDVRVFTTDPSGSFTVEFTSLVNEVTATWYKDDAPLSAGGDITIDTDPFAYSTLTIANPDETDEGKYYCILSVQPGTEDDLQTATRLLVINKLLAQFDFEQNLDDSSPNAAPSGQGKSVAGQIGDPNELLATDVAMTYDASGIDGYAVYLDGAQFIDLGTEGYPKAGPLDTIRDARGAGYEKSGFGRGMDQGSILCWVKLASDGVITSNANGADATHYAVTTNGTDSARIIIRGNNFDDSGQNLGEANGAYQMAEFDLQDGQWHMFAATWADSTARIYINGEQVAENTQGYTEKYIPWEYANLIGTSRLAGDRVLLNQNDFLTGSLDSLRVYNYAISADDIASEYQTLTGNIPCADYAFDGNDYNFDNTASSYCKVDLADFAVFAQNWLKNGLLE